MVGVVLVGLTLLLGAWILLPLLRGTRVQWEISEEDTPLGRLALRKEVLLGNLQDLDFEFAMGKLAEDDYRNIRDGLKRQTVKIMEQMDVVRSSGVAAPREHAGAATKSEAGCASCGAPLPSAARFCPLCGTKVGG